MKSPPTPRLGMMLVFSCLVMIGTLAGVHTLSGQAGGDDQTAVSDPETAEIHLQGRPGGIKLVPGAFVAPQDLLEAALAGGWVPVAPGIDYQLFLLPDPNRVHVARMDRGDPDLFLESAIGDGTLSGGVERVSAMAGRYDDAINFWGQSWGGRNDVVVAINGSFYNAQGIPDRGQLHSGWYGKRFSDFENGSGFVWKLDRTAFVGECVYHPPSKQVITYVSTGEDEKFQGVNIARGTNDLIIYTPQFDSSTLTDNSGVEMLVEMQRPGLVLPQPSMALGTVREIRDLQGDADIPFDHIVLSATGVKRSELLSQLQVGDTVGVSHEITHYRDDCVTPLGLDWTKSYAAVGGSFYFIKSGVIQTFTDPGATTRNPRTAIAFDSSYIYFIVVDGRKPGFSIGMTIAQLAAFTQNTLGATSAIAQDGGGSSTMVVNGQVVNTPSDQTETSCFFAYVPLVLDQPGQPPPGAPPGEIKCFRNVERAVANGMMMVEYRAKMQSGMFTSGQNVTTSGAANVRLGPGTNYAVLGTVPSGASGTVLMHTNGLNGVFAKGQFWWKVDFGSVEGWISETLLGP